MKNLSKNKKLNKVLNKIYEDMLDFGKNEVLRYKKEFPYEIDYNIYQYGNMLIYNDDIKELYKKAGYKSKINYTEVYKRQVGYIARNYFKDV